MDDAGGGRRGLRAGPSDELLDMLESSYGIPGTSTMSDLGGSSNLNLLVVAGRRKLVVRVYRPWVTPARLTDIQHTRRQLARRGVPCPVPIPASDGGEWTLVGGRLVEVEDYVEHDGHMDTWERVEEGLHVLGRMHTVLATIGVGTDAKQPLFANYLAPEDVAASVARGVARIRSWPPTGAEGRLADAAEQLARHVDELQQQCQYRALPRQLVHGDFWDNNVLYRHEELVCIHDFDHMGERARIDDVALTLYFMNAEPGSDIDHDRRRLRLRRLLDAYDAGLQPRLTAAERAALPLAVARQPLWSVGGWIASLDDQRAARAHASGMTTAVEFALGIVRAMPQWQETFA
jgi:homoserine kinase type II